MSGSAQDTGVLAQLMAQAAREGADLATMRGIAEEAGELSAMRALTRLGLADEAARGDLAELRELLGAWRDAKRSAWKAAFGISTHTTAVPFACSSTGALHRDGGLNSSMLIFWPTKAIRGASAAWAAPAVKLLLTTASAWPAVVWVSGPMFSLLNLHLQ